MTVQMTFPASFPFYSLSISPKDPSFHMTKAIKTEMVSFQSMIAGFGNTGTNRELGRSRKKEKVSMQPIRKQYESWQLRGQ